MALIVQKYGGTSVGSVERIGAVADRVARFKSEGHDVVVVVSAMSGETNRLLGLAKEIQSNPTPRELDVLLSTGEKVTTALLSMALGERSVRAKSYSGNQVGILTDSAHNKARIQDIQLGTLKSELNILNTGLVVRTVGQNTDLIAAVGLCPHRSLTQRHTQ